ncbi:hypothetical protein OROMI_007948 [Orobanche minor]
MYATIWGISCWALITGPGVESPPLGNAATGYFMVFVFLAGISGMATSAFGIIQMCFRFKSDSRNMRAIASVTAIAWTHTLIAMGGGRFACKEVQLYVGDGRLVSWMNISHSVPARSATFDPKKYPFRSSVVKSALSGCLSGRLSGIGS